MSRAALFLAVLLAASPAAGQHYPNKPVRLIAPAPPGSPVDVRARWVSEKLAPLLGQARVVENRAGAGRQHRHRSCGAERRRRLHAGRRPSGDDGDQSAPVRAYRLRPLADFAPITRLLDAVLMFAVHPQVPAQSVADLMRLAREQPGKLSYGSVWNRYAPAPRGGAVSAYGRHQRAACSL
jgi:tripartite-type tricarboxylate transporter receptor subunit TctC